VESRFINRQGGAKSKDQVGPVQVDILTAYRLARVNLLSIDPDQPTKTDRFGPKYAPAVLKAVTRNKLKIKINFSW
jgi:hypothetical protein